MVRLLTRLGDVPACIVSVVGRSRASLWPMKYKSSSLPDLGNRNLLRICWLLCSPAIALSIVQLQHGGSPASVGLSHFTE
jgi:hypothetical protein